MQHVFIIGAKSIGRYGGFETFVERLVTLHEGDDALTLHVACKANGDGSMDGAALADAVPGKDAETFMYHDASCFKVHVPQIGPAQAIWYDIAALRRCCKEIEAAHLQHPVVCILACRIGPFLGPFVRRIHAAGGKVYVNPDGHEWLRAKWSRPVRRYWKYSEKKTVQAADLIICDSRKIEDYIRSEYASYHPQTVYIAYGATLTPSPLADDDPALVSFLSRHGLRMGEYCLIVGRFVPENNYEVMLREYLASGTKRKLAIISTENKSFAKKLDERLHYTADPRIVFCGSVYDSALLQKIREGAYAYLHGHEVGGTNPSLLEALASTPLNLLIDVPFNREVGGDAALYWTKEKGALKRIIETADALDKAPYASFADAAKRRIKDCYRWEDIAAAYKRVFTEGVSVTSAGKAAGSS